MPTAPNEEEEKIDQTGMAPDQSGIVRNVEQNTEGRMENGYRSRSRVSRAPERYTYGNNPEK